MYTQETKVYYLSLVGAIILTVFLLSFLLSMIAQYKKNRQLFKEKLHAEIFGSEEERSRIAADIHDDVGPLLSVVRLQVEAMTASNQDEQKQVSTLHHIDRIMDRLAFISDSLVPSSLAPEGFMQAVKDYCDWVNTTGKIKITYNFLPGLSLPGGREIHLYRIIHELIHNAVKHSGARSIDITARAAVKAATFQIFDDGKGFNFHSALRKSTGRGLKNVMNRLEMIEGKMYINASENGGTSYLIEIPLHHLNNDDKNSNSRRS
ncbi:MAG: hypothetical protein JWN76_424 [Chitinophagaceae bacterium]|nr:hypothetical protein [Chitinophagaceae bacterium]